MSNSSKNFSFLKITKLISLSIIVLVTIKHFTILRNTVDLTIVFLSLSIVHFCDYVENCKQEKKLISILYIVTAVSLLAAAMVRLFY